MDVNNAYESMKRSLKRLSIAVIDENEDLLRGAPTPLLALIRRLLFQTSAIVMKLLLLRGCASHVSDKKIVLAVFDLLREQMKFQPIINVDQFFAPGYVPHKLNVLSKLAEFVALSDRNALSQNPHSAPTQSFVASTQPSLSQDASPTHSLTTAYHNAPQTPFASEPLHTTLTTPHNLATQLDDTTDERLTALSHKSAMYASQTFSPYNAPSQSGRFSLSLSHGAFSERESAPQSARSQRAVSVRFSEREIETQRESVVSASCESESDARSLSDTRHTPHNPLSQRERERERAAQRSRSVDRAMTENTPRTRNTLESSQKTFSRVDDNSTQNTPRGRSRAESSETTSSSRSTTTAAAPAILTQNTSRGRSTAELEEKALNAALVARSAWPLSDFVRLHLAQQLRAAHTTRAHNTQHNAHNTRPRTPQRAAIATQRALTTPRTPSHTQTQSEKTPRWYERDREKERERDAEPPLRSLSPHSRARSLSAASQPLPQHTQHEQRSLSDTAAPNGSQSRLVRTTAPSAPNGSESRWITVNEEELERLIQHKVDVLVESRVTETTQLALEKYEVLFSQLVNAVDAELALMRERLRLLESALVQQQ